MEPFVFSCQLGFRFERVRRVPYKIGAIKLDWYVDRYSFCMSHFSPGAVIVANAHCLLALIWNNFLVRNLGTRYLFVETIVAGAVVMALSYKDERPSFRQACPAIGHP